MVNAEFDLFEAFAGDKTDDKHEEESQEIRWGKQMVGCWLESSLGVGLAITEEGIRCHGHDEKQITNPALTGI